MKDLGAENHILGMEIKRGRVNRKLWLGQNCPTSHSEMEDMSRVPYQSVVEILMYAMVCTRPDIAQEVGVLSRYMSNLGRAHWEVVKIVFRYLKGTSEYSLCYHGNLVGDVISLDIHSYVDLDWVGDIDSRRYTNAYIITLFGGALSWMSKR
ncbi:hypothetical protein SUGI_0457800 [Cryptomeria japonica]|nr:hypothetical protein SUGI_0457800 [Cryptomeria japonica]